MYVFIDFTSKFAKLMLEMRTKHNVTHAALDCLCSGFISIMKKVLEDSHGENNEMKSTIKCLKKLSTQSSREFFFRKNFKFVKPLELQAKAPQLRTRVVGSKPKLVKHSFQYVSLRETLSALFSDSNFRKTFYSEKPSVDNFIRSHRDSIHFRDHPFFQKYPFALRLQLYYDDLEIVNPLGSKTKKNELGMFYFSILNLPTRLNSSLNNIFTFAVVKTTYLRSNNFEFVLKELMDEIAELESENGMKLSFESHPNFNIHGTIVQLCADSKGAHEIGGFMSSSAQKFCMKCLISRSEIKSKSRPFHLIPRTRHSHRLHVLASEETEQNHRTTGVKFDCYLHRSAYFHIVENLCFDILHDFFEGVIPFILKIVLREYVVNHPAMGFSAEVVNKRIENYVYPSMDSSNRPSPRFTDELLRKFGDYNTKQRGAQNFCLARLFGLMFGDLIPPNNSHFKLISTLIKILESVMSPIISVGHHLVLESLVEEIFYDFNQLFPDLEPINKFHHMVHYSEFMRTFGPPTRYWCMRYESFHNIVKKRAQASCNFINISKTVANHIQSKVCFELSLGFNPETEEIYGPCSTNGFYETITSPDLINVDVSMLERQIEITTARWIKLGAWTYKKNSVILLRNSYQTESHLPTFGLAKQFYIQKSTAFVMVEVLSTLRYNQQFMAFEMCNDDSRFVIVKMSELPDCEPLNLLKNFSNDGLQFVCPRHWI